MTLLRLPKNAFGRTTSDHPHLLASAQNRLAAEAPTHLSEYEDLLGRESNWRGVRLTAAGREAFLDIFLSICRWTRIHHAWRPNLGDEADNHLIELAVAGQANYLITRNVRHLRGGELRFPHILVATPTQLLKEQA